MITTSWGKFVLMKRPSPPVDLTWQHAVSLFFFLFRSEKIIVRPPSSLFDSFDLCVAMPLHIRGIMDLWPFFSFSPSHNPPPFASLLLLLLLPQLLRVFVICGLFSKVQVAKYATNISWCVALCLLSVSEFFFKHYSRSSSLSPLPFCAYVCRVYQFR
jgi:hypothetical protein